MKSFLRFLVVMRLDFCMRRYNNNLHYYAVFLSENNLFSVTFALNPFALAGFYEFHITYPTIASIAGPKAAKSMKLNAMFVRLYTMCEKKE